MGKNGIKVIVRTRPTSSFPTNQIQIDPDENSITIHSNNASSSSSSPSKGDSLENTSSISTVGGPSNRKDCWKFKYHQVLHNAGQEKVYDTIARDIVRGAVVDGINGTILAYGQTGAGKSFTMIGDTRNYQHRGIAPRAIAQLYEEIENRIEIAYTIRVSYMEIYNDRIYDLLDNGKTADSHNKAELVIVEDGKGTYVRGLTQVEAHNEQEALNQLFNGELQRTIAEHQLNKRSNRSHCIFSFHISQKSRAGGNERVTHSKLHLVDLAGSERLKKTMDEEKTPNNSLIMKESMYINQSLSFLEQCIVALGSKEQRHIPYRQTKLTNVLKDSLGGNSNTLMFACIWGESKHLEETISTLKLAQRMMRVQNEVSTIIETDPSILLRKYEKQIKELKQELLMHDALMERRGIVYDEHTPEQKNQLMKMIKAYVDAPLEKDEEILKFNSINDIRELFRQFKIFYKHLEVNATATTSMANGNNHGNNMSQSRHQSFSGSRGDLQSGKGSGLNGASGGSMGFATAGEFASQQQLVGEEDPNAIGFGIGLAPHGARPTSMDSIRRGGASDSGTTDPSHHQTGVHSPVGRQQQAKQHERNQETDTEVTDRKNSMEENSDTSTSIKNEAFQYFKSHGTGKKIHFQLQEEKDKQFEVKQRAKRLSTRLNTLKEEIDIIKEKLQQKRSTRSRSRSHPHSLQQQQQVRKASAGNTRTTIPSFVQQQQQQQQERDEEQEIVDEEEFILMTQEREAKREYRSLFDDLKEIKSELDFIHRSIELLRMRLVREFEQWYEEEGEGFHLRGVHTTSTTTSLFMSVVSSKEDKLDDGEKFEQMEIERIRAQNPDSLAFFQAQKKMLKQQQHHTTGSGGSGSGSGSGSGGSDTSNSRTRRL